MKKSLSILFTLFVIFCCCTQANAYDLKLANFLIPINNISAEQKEMLKDYRELQDKNENSGNDAYKATMMNLCNSGVTKYPNSPMFYLLRAHLYMKENKFTLAEADINKSISLNPNYSPIMYYLHGCIYFAQKKYTQAMDEFNNAIDLADSKGLHSRIYTHHHSKMMYFLCYNALANAQISIAENALNKAAGKKIYLDAINYSEYEAKYKNVQHFGFGFDKYIRECQLEGKTIKSKDELYNAKLEIEAAKQIYQKSKEYQHLNPNLGYDSTYDPYTEAIAQEINKTEDRLFPDLDEIEKLSLLYKY